jgi:regulatory protein
MAQLTRSEALKKIQRYCAYQERSHQDVKEKLFKIGAPPPEIDDIVSELIVEGYLNEQRYAKAFAGGKFRIKKWGKLKIIHALEQKGVSKNCVRVALKEIDGDDYQKTLEEILGEKGGHIEEKNLYVKRDKLSQFAIQKGYEPELVWEVLKKLFPDRK